MIRISSGSDQARLRVDSPHCGAKGLRPIRDILERWISYLEVSPKLIPQFPKCSALLVRLTTVYVLHPLGRFLWRTCPQIQSDLRLCSDEAAKGEKLVGAKLVVLGHAPGNVEHTDAFFEWPNSIPPVIGRCEVPAKTNYRGLQFTHHPNHVGVHAFDV